MIQGSPPGDLLDAQAGPLIDGRGALHYQFGPQWGVSRLFPSIIVF
jgi:hypothetical protein